MDVLSYLVHGCPSMWLMPLYAGDLVTGVRIINIWYFLSKGGLDCAERPGDNPRPGEVVFHRYCQPLLASQWQAPICHQSWRAGVLKICLHLALDLVYILKLVLNNNWNKNKTAIIRGQAWVTPVVDTNIDPAFAKYRPIMSQCCQKPGFNDYTPSSY